MPHHTQMSSARSVSSCVYQWTETREAEAEEVHWEAFQNFETSHANGGGVSVVSKGASAEDAGKRVHVPAILFVR